MTKKNSLYHSQTNGIVLVNKPQGPSSHGIAHLIKKIYQVKKSGHAGALDPLATGMLPVFLGEATKFVQYLLNADKVYRATALLGVNTATGDAWGEVIQTRAASHITQQDLLKVLDSFIGPSLQIPPMYSALKHNGTPLYKLARQGIEIERAARPIVIHSIQLIDVDGLSFTMDISCTKGTYIRTLIENIGDALQVGAHMTALHRLSTGGFSPDAMHTVAQLSEMNAPLDAYVLPVDHVLLSFLERILTEDECWVIRQGKQLEGEGADGIIRLYATNRQFIGLGEQINGVLCAKRLMQF